MKLHRRQHRVRNRIAVWLLPSRLPFLGVALAAALALLTSDALAHVQIDVGDGRYVMEVGFRDEPAFVSQQNALWMRVEEYATGGTRPVDGLAATLSAEVSKDGQSKPLPLVPRGDGVYEGVFVPTATGDYTFHIAGAIGEATVDETVTSGPNTFESVQPLSGIEFPARTPDPGQLSAQAAAANATAEMARTLAVAGLVAGLIGLVIGAVALMSGRQPRPEATASPLEPSGKLIR